MAERRENSVLISLRELRQIEDDRVSQEELDKRQREEQARLAREQAERQARDEAERQRREAEEAERQRMDLEQRRVREDQLRLEEAERRARVEGQMKLEQERLRLEMEAKAGGTRFNPKILIAVASVLVILIGGLGFYIYNAKQKEAKQAAAIAELQKQITDTTNKIERNNKETQALVAQLATEHDEAKRKELEAQLAAKQKEAEEARQRLAELNAEKKGDGHHHGGGGEKPSGPQQIKTKNCDPNDPLCGL